MDIAITYSDISTVVERSLSIIGKRSIDDQGNLLFKDITIGTREKEILSDYYRSAIMHLASELRKYVTLETPSSTSYTIRLTLDDDSNQALQDTIRQAVKEYLIAFALYSWFNVSAPRIYEKYLADAQNALAYLTYQVFHHQRPSSMPNPLKKKVDPHDN